MLPAPQKPNRKQAPKAAASAFPALRPFYTTCDYDFFVTRVSTGNLLYISPMPKPAFDPCIPTRATKAPAGAQQALRNVLDPDTWHPASQTFYRIDNKPSEAVSLLLH